MRAQKDRFTRSRLGNTVMFIFILLAGAFTVLPMIYCIVTSFKPMDELLAFPPRFFVSRPTWANFAALPGLLSNLSVPLSRYFFNSLFISTVITSGHIFIASMAAYVLSRHKRKWTAVIYVTVQFALLYNSYTLAVPQYLIFSKTGIIDTYAAYIIPALPSAMGIFLMKQYMDGSIPAPLIEVAKIDGAGHYCIFFRIVMPLVKPAWMTLLLFSFRDSWAIQPGGTIFSENLKTLPVVLGQITSSTSSGIASDIARAGSVMAASVIMMIPPIIVYLFSQSNVMETMGSAGIKE